MTRSAGSASRPRSFWCDGTATGGFSACPSRIPRRSDGSRNWPRWIVGAGSRLCRERRGAWGHRRILLHLCRTGPHIGSTRCVWWTRRVGSGAGWRSCAVCFRFSPGEGSRRSSSPCRAFLRSPGGSTAGSPGTATGCSVGLVTDGPRQRGCRRRLTERRRFAPNLYSASLMGRGAVSNVSACDRRGLSFDRWRSLAIAGPLTGSWPSRTCPERQSGCVAKDESSQRRAISSKGCPRVPILRRRLGASSSCPAGADRAAVLRSLASDYLVQTR